METPVQYKVDLEALKQMIDFEPHPAQAQIIEGQKRFTTVLAGRQFGKSKLVSYFIIKELLGSNKRIWLVAPNYDLTQRIFKNYLLPIVNRFPQDFKVSMDRYRIECKATGSSVECKSGENPVSLLGETLDLLVIDEAAEINEEVYERFLRPTLMVKRGKCILISTPTTKTNWFFKQYLNSGKEAASFHFTSYDNPYIDEDELSEIKRRTPETTWKQQYLAEPSDDGGKLFTGIRAAVCGGLEEPKAGHQYILGWDPARVHDYSAIVVLDRKTKHVVKFDRFSGLDWSTQIERVLGAAHLYNDAMILMDSTNMGDPLFETLRKEVMMKGYPILVEGYKIDSSEKKRRLIENLVVAIQNWEVSYPHIEQLIIELEGFSYTYSQAGNVKYSAPKGMFDDTVIALALAVTMMKRMPYLIDEKKRNTTRRTNFVRAY